MRRTIDVRPPVALLIPRSTPDVAAEAAEHLEDRRARLTLGVDAWRRRLGHTGGLLLLHLVERRLGLRKLDFELRRIGALRPRLEDPAHELGTLWRAGDVDMKSAHEETWRKKGPRRHHEAGMFVVGLFRNA